MLSVKKISFFNNTVEIFNNASFSVGERMKVGLVGKNGAGKTTLFKLISKEETPITGEINFSGTIKLVPQEVKADPKLTEAKNVREYIDPINRKRDFELKTILDGLELENICLNDMPINLSGGQKTKLALAKALIEEPDLLLLDEPTNYLDTKGKNWVSNFLKNYSKTFILISHDLELLDKHIDKVIAINTQTKKIEEYRGNYSNYKRIKQEKDNFIKRQFLNQQRQIKKMEKSLQGLYKKTSEKGVRQRVILQRRMEKMKTKLPELPEEIGKIHIVLPDPIPVGEIPISVKNIFKYYHQNPILENVSLAVRKKERIALVGPNGAGKTTLIKIMLKILRADSGAIEMDNNAKVGYYSQEFENFDHDSRVIEMMREKTNLSEEEIRKILARFGFKGNIVFQKISTLSGGEKTRLSMAFLLSQNNNLLILDEPTTYLDALSQRIILDVLKEYKGSMIVVSHTEEFIQELNPDRVLLLPENQIKHWSNDLVDLVSYI